MLNRLIWHYGVRECRPMPKADNDLQAIARAHRPTWIKERPEILAIFADLAPKFEGSLVNRTAALVRLRVSSARGGAARKAQLQAQKAVQTPSLPCSDIRAAVVVAKRSAEVGGMDFEP
jgi:hypothetical protein